MSLHRGDTKTQSNPSASASPVSSLVDGSHADLNKEIMEQLPKIVRQRLEARQKAGVHIDPDLLTAFKERSLGEHERVAVIEHLASCAECREIAVTAQPQFELAQVAAASPAAPARLGWFRAPILRWAAAVTCVLVVGTVATLRHREKTMSSTKPKDSGSAEIATYSLKPLDTEATGSEKRIRATPVHEPAPAVDTRLKPEVAAGAFNGEAKQRPQAKEMQKRMLAAPLSGQLGQPAGAGLRGGAVGARARTALAPPPPPASKIESQRAMAAYLQQNQVRQQRAQAAISTELVPEQGVNEPGAKDSDQETVAVAGAAPSSSETVQIEPKPSETRNAAPAAGQAQSGVIVSNSNQTPAEPSRSDAAITVQKKVMLQSAANFVAPQWTLSSDGAVLLRSLDAGKTWEMIPVAGKSGKPIFRTVAAIGPEVWVGGASGALYHSSDAGQHWVQVKPVLDGKILVADIIRIEFSDAQHLRLTTSTSAVLTTSDGALTWQRQ
jgi:photosystem II stability/assembly factor-like uncharacterized protein